MKISALNRFNIDDYSNSPQWFQNFLNNLNTIVINLNNLIQNNVDLTYNILCERQTVSLKHGVPITITLRSLKTRPTLVRVGYASGYVGTGAITAYNTSGTLQVTVYFSGTAPTGAVSTVLVFEP
jgi:hypothetical protein